MQGLEILAFVGVPVLRSVSGWLDNSLEDGKILPIEWRMLAQTLARVMLLSLMIYYGVGGVMDIDMIASSGSAYLADLLFHNMKKLRSK